MSSSPVVQYCVVSYWPISAQISESQSHSSIIKMVKDQRPCPVLHPFCFRSMATSCQSPLPTDLCPCPFKLSSNYALSPLQFPVKFYFFSISSWCFLHLPPFPTHTPPCR